MGITWNYFCKKREIPKIQAAYGNAVKVNGKKMTVEIAGLQAEESPVIVLLPGLGSPSPVLEFRPLAEKLGKTYKVITVEPFGYGLSDPADTERSIENIVEELHACLEEIGVHRYYLMAHSISGLYSLYYAVSPILEKFHNYLLKQNLALELLLEISYLVLSMQTRIILIHRKT